jgi:hypothetical protein
MKIVGKPENMSLSGDIRLDYRIIINEFYKNCMEEWLLSNRLGKGYSTKPV